MPRQSKAGTAGWRAVAILAVLAVAGCAGPKAPGGGTQVQSTPVLSRPGEVAVQGRYVHAGSGLAFPADGTAAGARFTRITITQFDSKGEDVSANYDVPTPSGRMRISAYVYPSPAAFFLVGEDLIDASGGTISTPDLRTKLCRQEMEWRKQELLTLHPAARLIREGAVEAPHNSTSVPGNIAVYETDDFINNKSGPVRSEIHIFCYVEGIWIVKYRVTPVQDGTSEAVLADFMRQVPWTRP